MGVVRAQMRGVHFACAGPVPELRLEASRLAPPAQGSRMASSAPSPPPG